MNALSIPTPPPTDVLELRAADQRRRLHNSVVELKSQMRERLDTRKLARQYLWPATGALALVGMVLGYGLGSMFVRD
jgi:hypothetical protein